MLREKSEIFFHTLIEEFLKINAIIYQLNMCRLCSGCLCAMMHVTVGAQVTRTVELVEHQKLRSCHHHLNIPPPPSQPLFLVFLIHAV